MVNIDPRLAERPRKAADDAVKDPVGRSGCVRFVHRAERRRDHRQRRDAHPHPLEALQLAVPGIRQDVTRRNLDRRGQRRTGASHLDGRHFSNLSERWTRGISGRNELQNASADRDECARREVRRRCGAGEHEETFGGVRVRISRVTGCLDEEPVGFASGHDATRNDQFTRERRSRAGTLNVMNRGRAWLRACTELAHTVGQRDGDEHHRRSQSTTQPSGAALNEHRPMLSRESGVECGDPNSVNAEAGGIPCC